MLKVISSGTHTTEWFKNTFTSYYPNCYYISANPFISSRNVLRLDYEPSKHFEKVIDCWDYLWDDYLGTVLPWDLTREALSIILRNPHKRFVIHYIQPHSPYIALLGYEKRLYPDVVPSRQGILNQNGSRVTSELNFLGKILRYVKWSLPLLVGHEKNAKIREILRLPPAEPFEATLRILGRIKSNDVIRYLYTVNLILVLESASLLVIKILEKFPEKRIVITSDHGELLGEGGYYEHESMVYVPQLLEVPFFIVNRAKPQLNFTECYIKLLAQAKLKYKVRTLKTKLSLKISARTYVQ